MTVPRATMRLQFHRGFTLDDGSALVPYFAPLGVSHLYLSPILTARPGSLHGYDVVDPTRVNPELGGEDGFRRLGRQSCVRHGMGLILDIVPNHMAVGNENPWWMDVLRQGRDKPLCEILRYRLGTERSRLARQGRCCRSSGDLMAKRSRRRNKLRRKRMSLLIRYF